MGMQPRGARHQRQEHEHHAQQRVSSNHAADMAIAIPAPFVRKTRARMVCAPAECNVIAQLDYKIAVGARVVRHPIKVL